MPRPKSDKATTTDSGDKKKRSTKQAGKDANESPSSNEAKSNGSAQHDEASGLDLLQVHRDQLRGHISELQSFKPDAESVRTLRTIFIAWSKYAVLTDEIVLPAFEEAGVEVDRVNESRVEHDLISLLMSDLRDETPDDKFFPSKLKLLLRQITTLIDADEDKSNSLFAKVEGTELDLEELGHELKATMSKPWFNAEEMMSDMMPRHLRGPGSRNISKEHQYMRGQDRDRDDQGRFMSDDERGSSHRGSRSMRGGGGYDDDRRHSQSQNHRGRSRDDDDGRGYRSQSSGGYRGRHEDDNDHRGMSRSQSSGGGRGRSESSGRGGSDSRHGGWFGDSEGHSEAARRGWDNPSHGDSGWFGDSEGHSEASRRGWRNPDHGDSGWFGDREGHSEASRRGWRNSDHGDSGWFGDSEGHSEASRRGWEGRRRDDDDDNRSRRSSGGGRYSGRGRYED